MARAKSRQEFGTPYSVGEARRVASTHALDPYHRDLILWLCGEIDKAAGGKESVVACILCDDTGFRGTDAYGTRVPCRCVAARRERPDDDPESP